MGKKRSWNAFRTSRKLLNNGFDRECSIALWLGISKGMNMGKWNGMKLGKKIDAGNSRESVIRGE